MIQPIILLTDQHKSFIKDTFKEAISLWSKEWLLRDKTGQVIDFDFDLEINQSPRKLNQSLEWSYSDNLNAGEIIISKDSVNTLINKLVPNYNVKDALSNIEISLASSSLEDLLNLTFKTKFQLENTPLTTVLEKNSWFLHIIFDGQTVGIQLPSSWLSEQFVKQSDNKTVLKAADALHSQAVKLKVSLNKTTIKVSDTLNLQPGDVLQLEHKIFEPFNLQLEDSTPIAKCNLGKSDSNKSILIS